MKYKLPEYEKQLERSDENLKLLVKWLDHYAWEQFRKEVTVTCVSRTRAETVAIYLGQINPNTGKNYEKDEVPGSTHETVPCRAVDISCRQFSDAECAAMVTAVNEAWTYDLTRPNKKCCVFHKVGNSALHFHLQAHPKTVWKERLT